MKFLVVFVVLLFFIFVFIYVDDDSEELDLGIIQNLEEFIFDLEDFDFDLLIDFFLVEFENVKFEL